MPDLDIISRVCLPKWRAPMRLLLSEEEPREVARSINSALAAVLRQEGGLPGLDAFCAVVRGRSNGVGDPHSAYTEVDRIEHLHGHGRHAKVAGLAVKGLLARVNQGERLPDDIERVVADAFCRRLVDHGLFGHFRPEAIGGHFPGRREAEARQEACRTALAPSLRRFAERVARDPHCSELRAPRLSRRRSISTEEILDQPIM